jgi:transcription elongation factor Elf1
MLTAYVFECPYCQSENVVVRQMGHFVNTLMMFCAMCERVANFRGPEVIWTKELQEQKVRDRFEPYPV